MRNVQRCARQQFCVHCNLESGQISLRHDARLGEEAAVLLREHRGISSARTEQNAADVWPRLPRDLPLRRQVALRRDVLHYVIVVDLQHCREDFRAVLLPQRNRSEFSGQDAAPNGPDRPLRLTDLLQFQQTGRILAYYSSRKCLHTVHDGRDAVFVVYHLGHEVLVLLRYVVFVDLAKRGCFKCRPLV